MEVPATPPDGGWGWMVVLGAALINMVNQALFSIFGLIFGETLKEMAGGKATGITLVMAINVMFTNFSGLAVAAILRRLSIQTVTLIGIFCVGSGMILSSFATQIYHIALAYGCLTGLGLGLLASSTFLVITQFFTTRKSTAVGMAMAGTSIGQMIMPLIVGYLLESYEFSGTTRILGCVSFTGIVGAVFFKPIWCFKGKSNAQEKDVEKEIPYETVYIAKEHAVDAPDEHTVEFRKAEQKDDLTNNNILRPPSTNPFEDELDSDEDQPSRNRPPSTNPFGSSSEDEREEIVRDEAIEQEKQEILRQISNLAADDSEPELRDIENRHRRPPSVHSITSSENEGEEMRREVLKHTRNLATDSQDSLQGLNNKDSYSDMSDDDISTEETNFHVEPEPQPRKSDLMRPPSTNPFGSYSDIVDVESIQDPDLEEERRNVLGDIAALTSRSQSTNPFGSMDNMLDIREQPEKVTPQPFKRQFGKKMSANPFGSVDELASKSGPTPKKRNRLFPNGQQVKATNPEETKQLIKKPATVNKNMEILKTTNVQSGSIDINPTYCSRLSENLGLRLLNDIKFIHLLIGLAFGYVSTVTFSTFFPMFLQDEARLTIRQTTMCMTALSLSDIIGRLTVSEISRKLKLTSRSVFIIGAIVLGISRSLLVYMTEYKTLLIFSFVVGYCRAATVITQNLVVSDYIGSVDLAAAVGLNMVTKGIFVLTIGQSLGLLKDELSYAWCIHTLDIILFVVAISWSLEIACSKYWKKSSK